MPAAALEMLADPFSQHIHIPVKVSIHGARRDTPMRGGG
jgi:hypothetical protein